MPRIVQHLAVNCRDKPAQEAFYTKHFGFRRARVFGAGTPTEFVMLRLGDCCLEFFQADVPPEARGGEQPVGFKHLAIEVEDIAATVAGLKADGIETGPIIDCSDQVPGLSVCFLNDPEGMETSWDLGLAVAELAQRLV